jgi:hypothetical protein
MGEDKKNDSPRMPMKLFQLFAPALPAVALALAIAGCDVDSVDSSTAVVSNESGAIYDFSGLYMHPNASTNALEPLVYPLAKQTGAPVTWIRLIQYGSKLEGFDNVGLAWEGTLTGIRGTTASFSLSGQTSAAQPVQIAGSLIYESQRSTMDAAWLEPTFSGNVFARAVVAPATTNATPATKVSISPTSATLSASNSTITFTASGGNGVYAWTQNSSAGTLSSTSGTSIRYTYRSTGNDTLTVTSDGESAIANIVCQ